MAYGFQKIRTVYQGLPGTAFLNNSGYHIRNTDSWLKDDRYLKLRSKYSSNSDLRYFVGNLMQSIDCELDPVPAPFTTDSTPWNYFTRDPDSDDVTSGSQIIARTQFSGRTRYIPYSTKYDGNYSTKGWNINILDTTLSQHVPFTNARMPYVIGPPRTTFARGFMILGSINEETDSYATVLSKCICVEQAIDASIFYLAYYHYDDSSKIWVVDKQLSLSGLFSGYAGTINGFQQTGEWAGIIVTREVNLDGSSYTVSRLQFNPESWLDNPVVDARASIENPSQMGSIASFTFGVHRMVSISNPVNWNSDTLSNFAWEKTIPIYVDSYLNAATGIASSTHSTLGFQSVVARIGGAIPLAVTVTARDGWGDLCTPGETVRIYLDTLAPEPTQEDGALALTYEGPFRDTNGVPLSTSVNTVLDADSQAVVYYHPPRTGVIREEIVHAVSPG